VRRERRSAKEIVNDYTNELLMRSNDAYAEHKLLAIETIAFRMGWNEIYERLRFRKKEVRQPRENADSDEGLKWWQK
jgi:hypothetical protein